MHEVAGQTFANNNKMRPGDKVRPKEGIFLPFVRFDTSAVAPEIVGEDPIYIQFTYSENVIDGGDGSSVKAEATELTDSMKFRIQRKDGKKE
eukprot:CAMPEP_0197682096 /NCGR_PEP_ID=MMETSP1338-20131121/95970_1 /TAXON_ID=43686 ORGANISM="Pelagodinium beii, Strain RCC1491" /NCGR_SAMPLE_ID=MMETSP1338 /ASSEMBLY_ACC=CAM_ASM_000754 /LENGTH=91 /DNA_ID=CAMNT_0043263521 /DNA_START=22 /DNA_END=294 /DNA_ORIENTATION=+